MMPQSRRRAALATLTGTGLTVGITVAQAFVLIPLCLSALGTHVYGAWLGATELLVWIQLLDVGIPNLLTQRVGAALGRDDRADAARWSATGLGLLVLIGAVLVVAGLMAAPVVTVWAQVPDDQAAVFIACFRISVAASACLLLSNGLVGLSRGVQQTALVNAAQVAGAVTGLAVAVGLLLAGWGLWALAFGLLARALVSLMGGTLFLVGLPAGEVSWWARPSRALAREIAGLAPSMGSASVGYLLANNSEILLVTTFFGPVPAAVYALTRRAIDGLRNLLDSIAWAAYGGFAHLVTAEDRHRSRAVLHDVLWLRLALACLCGAIAVAVNRAFVTMLFGAETFGGFWLTLAFALQMILAGQSFLTNFLLRSTGQVREGSWLLTGEAIARVLAMVAGLLTVGLVGAPAASAFVSLVALGIVRRRLDAVLPDAASEAATPGPSVVAPVCVLALGIGVAAVRLPITWTAATTTAMLIGLTGSAMLWRTLRATPDRGALLRWHRR